MFRYDAVIEAIDERAAHSMRGKSWHDDGRCPAFADLAVLHLPYVDLSGQRRRGRLVVARDVADDIVHVFARLDAIGFPIARMDPIDTFDGDDDQSMAANNCSGFNFRCIAGTDRLSRHALGRAVDINPVYNPWVRGDRVLPPDGAAFVDRRREHPAMIRRPGPVVAAFDDIGWTWGGDWDRVSDYHHFEL